MLAMQETRVQSLGREDPPEKGMATPPIFLTGESHGQGSLVGYSLILLLSQKNGGFGSRAVRTNDIMKKR